MNKNKTLEGRVFWDIVEAFEENGAPTKEAVKMAHDIMDDLPLEILSTAYSLT